MPSISAARRPLFSLSSAVSGAALAASLMLVAPAAAQGNIMESTPATNPDVTTQLPRNAMPTNYAITVTPDAEKLAFTGNVKIDVKLVEPSTSVMMNAADLTISKATLTPAKGGRAITLTVATDNDAQTATLTFPKQMPAGNYIIEMDYAGKIYQQANGLFALDYKDANGADKRSLFTQFEAPDARRFVPSWDEPDYKATFDLTANVPGSQMAVSNMPIVTSTEREGGMKTVHFGKTPIMSSYLLFFGLGEFGRITNQVGDTEVGIVMGKGNEDKAQYALQAASQILPYYNDYFGTPFPLPKLDNIAGPGQSQFFSAMENWGAIFSFERILLNDPKITSEGTRQAIFAVSAHEMAHQWFGDLVTMEWWDDLWLNEGFASWMESKTTAHFNPDWQAELDRVGGRESAMALDGYATTHPIVQKIKTVEQTSQAFDSITYQKGEAVITMLEAFAGPETWRSGIRSYIKQHAYQNTETGDLWRAVENAGAEGLRMIANDFTQKPGIPLIRVGAATCQGGATMLQLTQGEFSRDRKTETAANPQSWNVPVIARSLGGDAVTTVVAGGKGSVKVAGCTAPLVNAGQSGYYRTLYTPKMNAALTQNFAKLPAIDQLGLINDGLALAYADYQPVAIPLDMLAAVGADANQKVIDEAIGDYYGMYDLFKDDPAMQAKIAAEASGRFDGRLKKLGFATVQGEPVLDALLRSGLISTLGGMGDKTVTAEADRLFAALESDPVALDGPLRTTWLGIIASNADAQTWNKLHAMAKNADNQVVRTSLYSLLGAANDEMLAQQALDLALTDEPGPTVSAGIISSVAREHPDLAVDYVLAHLDQVSPFVDVASRSRFIARLAAASRDEAMIGKLNSYAAGNLDAEARKPVDQTIASIQNRVKSTPRIKAGISQWFAAHKK